VGWYGDRVLPRLIDLACRGQQTDRLRALACAGLTGRVLELGFGSGRNLPFYPAAVTAVDAVEPNLRAWELSAARRTASPAEVRRAGLDGQSLPLTDASADVALSTWTLCTIPDVDAALTEVLRVLRPGGALHFVEHGLAPDASVQRWQRRLEPVQQRLAGGCHLTREIPDLLARNGFEVVELHREYLPGTLRAVGSTWQGLARPR
jgi:SAM-dependent methyltransferase